jgi:DegV family protein with EDD domain
MAPRCNLIIDSCCDMPAELVKREGVQLLCFPYSFGEEVHTDDLWQSSSSHDFYERMRKGEAPSTAQLSIPTMVDAFTNAAKSGVPTVYIAFSSGLTGTVDTARAVLDKVKESYPESEIYIVDSQIASIAEGLLVYEAIRQREKGLTARELVDWVEEARWFINAIFMLDDFDALRRGGRIPSSVAQAGSKLDVKPLLSFTLDGKLTVIGVARGRKKAIRQIAEYGIERCDQDEKSPLFVTGQADCPKDQERLEEMVRKEREGAMFIHSTIGPVIGSHVGPGMLAMVFWGKDRREDLSMADRIAKRIKRDE